MKNFFAHLGAEEQDSSLTKSLTAGPFFIEGDMVQNISVTFEVYKTLYKTVVQCGPSV